MNSAARPELGLFDRVVYEWHDHERVKAHFVLMHASQEAPKAYTGAVSADAFREHHAKLHYKALQKDKVQSIRFDMMRADDYKRDLASWSHSAAVTKHYEEMPFQVHENLWNFYESIGWDYKKKKLSVDDSAIEVAPKNKVKP